MTETITDASFAVLALTLLFFSVAVVLLDNPVRAVFLLIFSFVPTAGVYTLMYAPFVGVLQILVYSGAILILFTFVVMMINPAPDEGAAEKGGFWERAFFGGGAVLSAGVIAFLALRAMEGLPASGAAPEKADFGSIQAIGELLFIDPLQSPYSVSFLLMAFLILAGIVAAINLARGKHQR